MTTLKLTLTASLIVTSHSLWATDDFCQMASQTINQTADDFWQYGSYAGQYDDEKYNEAYTKFNNNIKVLLKDKRSLACDWQPLESVKVVTSPDKELRSFSWDLGTGGTMHEFEGVIQTQDNQGNIRLIDTLANDNSVGLVSAIHQMTLKNQISPVYIINQYMIGSSALRMEMLNLYQLDNGVLTPIKLIQTRQLTDKLSFEYSLFSIPKPWQDRQLIQVDSRKNQLSIPVVIENKGAIMGKVTPKRIVYQYNGNVFERVKN